MNLLIYTDGSYRAGEGVAASILLTETEYVGMIVKRYRINNGSLIELLSILQTLEFLDKRRDTMDIDAIVLSTDAAYLIDMYEKIKRIGFVPPGNRFRRMWKKIIELSDKYNFTMVYVASHQTEDNPNKACDIVGKVHRLCGTVTLVRG